MTITKSIFYLLFSKCDNENINKVSQQCKTRNIRNVGEKDIKTDQIEKFCTWPVLYTFLITSFLSVHVGDSVMKEKNDI